MRRELVIVRYLLLFGTTILLAIGQVLFKLSSQYDTDKPLSFLFSPVFILSLAVYGTATILWILTLRQFPLTVAYPAQAIAIVTVMVIGIFFFGESLSLVQIAGAVAILIGVVALAAG